MRCWDPNEDTRLLDYHTQLGGRWKQIAAMFGTANPRTPAMVRNRFLRIEKGRKIAAQGGARNKCGKCGAIKKGHICTRYSEVVDIPSVQVQEQHHRETRRLLEIPLATALVTPGLATALVSPSGGHASVAVSPVMETTADVMAVLAAPSPLKALLPTSTPCVEATAVHAMGKTAIAVDTTLVCRAQEEPKMFDPLEVVVGASPSVSPAGFSPVDYNSMPTMMPESFIACAGEDPLATAAAALAEPVPVQSGEQ